MTRLLVPEGRTKKRGGGGGVEESFAARKKFSLMIHCLPFLFRYGRMQKLDVVIYLEVNWIEVDGVGELQVSTFNHGDDARETKNFIVVTIRVPLCTQLLVAQILVLVHHTDVVNYLQKKKEDDEEGA